MHSYIFWALLGMAGYSFGTFFVKLAERGGAASAHIVLAVASAVVAICGIVTVCAARSSRSSPWSRALSGRSPPASRSPSW